jgi:aspartate aminotransferase
MFEEGNRLKEQYGRDKVFDFSLGNPDLDPPPAFHEELCRLALEDQAGSHAYMPNAGYAETRAALAEKAGREHQVRLDASRIVMAAGAAGALNVVLKAVLNPGDEVLTSSPYFMEYQAYAANHGGRLVPVESLPDFSLDIPAIGRALSPKTAAVLINSPHNPTGRVYPASDLEQLAETLRRHGAACGRYPYLIADEPYREIAYGIDVPPVLCVYDESIAVSSYSKSLSLPGERIGFIAVGPKAGPEGGLIDALIYATRVLGFVNAPALMQRIVARLVNARVDVSVYERRRDAFKRILDDAGIAYAEPQGAFYLFCEAPKRAPFYGDDRAFVEALKRERILGVPGAGFGKAGWVRFAYCVDEALIRAAAEPFKRAAGATS